MIYVITAKCAFWRTEEHTFRTGDLFAWFDRAFAIQPSIQIVSVQEIAA